MKSGICVEFRVSTCFSSRFTTCEMRCGFSLEDVSGFSLWRCPSQHLGEYP